MEISKKILTSESVAMLTKEIKINAIGKRLKLLPKRYLPNFEAG